MARSDFAGLSYHCVLCLLILTTPNYSGAVVTWSSMHWPLILKPRLRVSCPFFPFMPRLNSRDNTKPISLGLLRRRGG